MADSPVPYPKYDDASISARGEARARALVRRLAIDESDLRGARVLEVGCGRGETTAATRAVFGANAVGIDPVARWRKGPFAALEDEGVYQVADITSTDILALGTFDYVQSYTVWEHIDDPVRAIEMLARLVRPGGRAYLNYNLYRGSSASHLVQKLEMPWVHLTHTDAEIEELMLERHGVRQGPSWVNKMTFAHYLHYFPEYGFDIERTWYDRTKLEPELYDRHREVFDKYPRQDLERNFMHVVLRRRGLDDDQPVAAEAGTADETAPPPRADSPSPRPASGRSAARATAGRIVRRLPAPVAQRVRRVAHAVRR